MAEKMSTWPSKIFSRRNNQTNKYIRPIARVIYYVATEKHTQSCQFLVISLGKVISSRRKDVIKFLEKLEDDIEKMKEIVRNKQKTEQLVSRMLPREVFKQLSEGETVMPQPYDNVTIY